MKSFFKAVMANIVAILIVFAACFFFFIILIAIGSMGQNGVKVKKNSVLTLDFKTNIIDSPTEGEDNVFSLDEENDNVLLYDVLQAIEKAKNDDNIKGISIETDNISAGESTFMVEMIETANILNQATNK